MPSQTKIPYQTPHQIDLLPPSPEQVQTQQIKVLTPVLIIPTVTPHIADRLHTGAHQLTLGTTADHDPIQHTNQVRKPCINLHLTPAELTANCMIKEVQES